MNTSTPVNQRQQSGVALVISLMLLVAVTLVGLASIRGTALQEQMAGNHYDREVAFQAAEAALVLGTQKYRNDHSSWDTKIEIDYPAELDCSNRTCALNPRDDVSNNLWETLPSSTTGFESLDTTNRPQYLVQRMGDCSIGQGDGFVNVTDMGESGGGGSNYLQDQGTCYRITARAYNPKLTSDGEKINAERAQVVLQATWRL